MINKLGAKIKRFHGLCNT